MNFQRLVAPVFIAVTLSVTAFIAVVVVAALLQDEAAHKGEIKVVSQNIAAVHRSLAILAEDNAWWDETVAHITIEEDIEWMDSTIGESVTGIKEVQGVLVLRPDSSLIYANYVNAPPAPHILMENGFSDLVQSFPMPEPEQPSSRSGFLMIEDQLVAYGASLVQAAGIKSFDENVFEGGHDVIIFLSMLSNERLAEIGETNAIRGLTLAQSPQTDHATLPIHGLAGETISFLTWETSAPGSQMIRKMVIPAIVLLVVVAIAMFRFINQANRLVKELETANKAKSAFLASTSHEIRTPLNAILGFTELISLELYGKVEGKKNKEYLEHIKDSGEHLLSIINDILDISKLEAERFDIYSEKVDPLLAVNASLKIIQPQANDKNIEIHTDCCPAEIYSDERIMRQILINLLSNAVKFTEPGGQIMITGKPISDKYMIVVKDTGIGMSETELKTALDLFGQVQSEYARNHSGTGLGLPLVRRFMELLGGDFSITSRPGEGTSVTLSFPLYASKPA